MSRGGVPGEKAEPESLIEAGVNECAGEEHQRGEEGERQGGGEGERQRGGEGERQGGGEEGEGQEDVADAYSDLLSVRTSPMRMPKRIKSALKLPKGMLTTRREDFFP